MQYFEAIQGETIIGIGIDFAERFAPGETAENVTVSAPEGITIEATGVSQTTVHATVTIAGDYAPGDLKIRFTATGSSGSVRSGFRYITINAK